MGAALLVGGVTPLLLGITKAPDWGWSSAIVLLLIAEGIVVIGLFILRQRRARFPLIDLSLFNNLQFSSGLAAGIFATIALATMALLFPFYWQGLRGYSAQTAGLLMMPIPLSLMFTAPIAGRLSDTMGSRWIATIGLVVVMTGLFLISQLTATMTLPHVLWRLVVFGSGLGMFVAPNNNAVMSTPPAPKRGIASGLLGMSRYSGQCFGIAFGATMFATFATAGAFTLHGMPTSTLMASAASDPVLLQNISDAFMNGMQTAVLCAIPLAGIGALLSVVGGSRGRYIAPGGAVQEEPSTPEGSGE